jgi:hypothetical protein
MRPCLSERLMRASSGVSLISLLPRKATAPSEAVCTPAPAIDPVGSGSANFISPWWTEPATARSTKAPQRLPPESPPEIRLVMSCARPTIRGEVRLRLPASGERRKETFRRSTGTLQTRHHSLEDQGDALTLMSG